mgnify:CR=1 FL=1
MEKFPFYLILPNIRSAHNVGAMFRTADGCGVTKLFLVGYTPSPPHPKIAKVSLGAEQWMKWEKVGYLKPLVKRLKKKGVVVVALEQTGNSIDIARLVETRQCLVSTVGIALIVGNEVSGIPRHILKLADHIVHIPMRGMKESLNVSVAAGIGMYEFSRLLMAH